MVIWTIAKTTVSEAMRKKVLNVCLIVAVAMIVLGLSFTQLGFKQDMTVVKSLGLFVILLAGFVISLILCVALIPNEVDRRTIYTILSKPVKRYEFVVGKYLGGLVTLFVNIALMGVVFLVMVAIKAHYSVAEVGVSAVLGGGAGVSGTLKPELFDPSLALGIVLIYFQFALLSAVVMFFSVFMTPTVNYFASAAVYIVGVAAPMWQSISSKQSQASAPVKAAYKVIHTLFPNFDYFNVQNKLIHPQLDVPSLERFILLVIFYALAYVAVAMTVAVVTFERKEV